MARSPRASNRPPGATSSSRPPTRSQPSAGKGPWAALGAAAAGFFLAAGIGAALLYTGALGPRGPVMDPPSPLPPASALNLEPSASSSASSAEAPPRGSAATPSTAAPDAPRIGAISLQAPVHLRMEPSRQWLGYLRLGAKVPVDPTPIKNDKCPQGWFRLLDGGYICGKHATLDLKNPKVRLGITTPNLDELLPYRYAHNSRHGTPLYRAVPSRDEMLRYEPYLDKAPKTEKPREAAAGGAPPQGLSLLQPGEETTEEEEDKPWWQKDAKDGKVEVSLDELTKESDSNLAKRMVKGFFVAVDKAFAWNSRQWYKTTGLLVAPADRMTIVSPPAGHGMPFPEGASRVGFVLKSKAHRYAIDEKGQFRSTEPVERLSPVGLTGTEKESAGQTYFETTDGWWLRKKDATWTEPGPRPDSLGPAEKWIDVNLTRNTLVAFEGTEPVYAALISPGKRSKTKKLDHSTVEGVFRIREKHLTTTMDGDGTVAGDLPYSIEDVPYVAYFDGSYAFHGAFWHNQFGNERSHGCVNLSPLDAKHLFFWSEPALPAGWHGIWASEQNRGTVIVTHR